MAAERVEVGDIVQLSDGLYALVEGLAGLTATVRLADGSRYLRLYGGLTFAARPLVLPRGTRQRSGKGTWIVDVPVCFAAGTTQTVHVHLPVRAGSAELAQLVFAACLPLLAPLAERAVNQ